MGEWVLHDGRGCPFKVGQRVSIRYRCGYEHGGTVTVNMTLGLRYDRGDRSGLNPLFWAVSGRKEWMSDTDIIAYIIHDDGAEAAIRAERSANFRRMADDALKGDKPMRAPQKERVQ